MIPTYLIVIKRDTKRVINQVNSHVLTKDGTCGEDLLVGVLTS